MDQMGNLNISYVLMVKVTLNVQSDTDLKIGLKQKVSLYAGLELIQGRTG